MMQETCGQENFSGQSDFSGQDSSATGSHSEGCNEAPLRPQGDGKFEDYFRSARVGLYRSRVDTGKILDCNDQLAHLFGYASREECIAEYTRERHHADAEMLERLRAAIGSRKYMSDFETKILRKDGQERWLSFWATIDHERGYIDGAAIDVTVHKEAIKRITAEVAERVHLERVVAETKAAAEAAQQAKIQLLTSLSTELLAPANAIAGMTESILKEDISEEARARLRVLHESVHHLAMTVNRLLGSQTQRSLKVLLVEDTPANQLLVQKLLGKRGHQVWVAGNGEEALEKIKDQNFNVVLMDLQLPGINGHETTRKIRAMADPLKAATPIIALTAHAMASDQHKCLDGGMNGYISKPFDLQEFVKEVERVASDSKIS